MCRPPPLAIRIELAERGDELAVCTENFGQPVERRPIRGDKRAVQPLDQARLVLAEQHGIGEADLRRELKLGDARSFALFQIEFYGELQFCFIREVQREL